MTVVLEFPRHVQHEGVWVCYHLTRRQFAEALAVLSAWWCMDGVTLLSHEAALRIALLLARRCP